MHRSALNLVALLVLGTLIACGGSGTPAAAPTTPAGDAVAPGSSPTSPQAATEAAGSGEAQDPFALVFAELEGLQGADRTERLAELAREEGGVNVYTSSTDMETFGEAFTDLYDVEVSVYRGQSNQVLQRLLQEADAGFAGADLVETNAVELSIVNSEGLLRDYEGPAHDGLVEAALQDGWTGTRLAVFTVAWNSDLVGEPPTTYADLADDRFSGRLMIEPRAGEWYMALHGYLMEEEGMSEEEVDELFRNMAENAVLVTGNTSHAQFLASGEYAISANVYNHLIDELIVDNAPVSRTPDVEPLVVRPNGAGLIESAQNPASALLLFEWLLNEGQQYLVDEYRIPVREDYQQGQLEGVETVVIDVEQLASEGTDWETRFEELLRNAQGAGN